MKFMKGGASGLLTNKMVLIIVAILAAFNIIGYMMYGMTHLVIIYGIVAALSYLFSNKNMILTLGVPLIVVNALIILHKQTGMLGGLEGLEGMDASMNRVKTAVKAKAIASKHDIQVPHNDATATDTTTDTTTTDTATTDDVEPHSEESFEGNTKKGRYRIDYASTIEDAYKELNTVLGGDGIKNLTTDTHNLMKKQLEMAETLKTMAPLVQSMTPLMKQVQGLMPAMGAPSAVAAAAR